MIRLRAHHLMCIPNFRGRGYSEGFVRNMTHVTAHLRAYPAQEVEVVFSADDLCRCCPHRTAERICDQEEKVFGFDRRAARLLGIRPGIHAWSDLARAAARSMTEQKLKTVCGDCQWADVCLDAVRERREKS